MTRYVALLPTMQIWMATVAILMIGASSAAFISKAGVPGTKALASLADCPVLDRAARAKVAMLINDDSGAEELRVDEALSQLRRARKFCRTGDSTAARYDYESLSVLQTPQSLVLDRD